MVKMINATMGTVMWVAEDRVEEYKSAGHKLADVPVTTTKAEPKTSRKKTEKKK